MSETFEEEIKKHAKTLEAIANEFDEVEEAFFDKFATVPVSKIPKEEEERLREE